MHSLASSCFDHVSLLLSMDSVHHAKKWFHFHSFWTRLPGFREVVQQAWHCPLGNISPFCKLDWLIYNMACFWATPVLPGQCQCVGNIRSQLEVIKKVMH
jgi:hypothetical protein